MRSIFSWKNLPHLTCGLYFDNYRIMESQEVVQAFVALGQLNRLAVFRYIVEQGASGVRPLEASAALGIPPATLSFHLKELYQADLVSIEREGRNMIYRPRPETIDALMKFLLHNCCGGRECLPTSAPKRSSSRKLSKAKGVK